MAKVKLNAQTYLHVGVKSGPIGRNITLRPGINDIPEGDVIALLENPVAMKRVHMGIIELLDLPKTATIKKDFIRNVDSVLKIIPTVRDTKLLKGLIDYDGRPEVVQAAEKRLSDLKLQSQAVIANEHFK